MNDHRASRERIVKALKLELLGPSDPNELISEFPTSRYIIGRLAPAQQSDDDCDSIIDQFENDTLGAGIDDEENSEHDPQTPLIIGFNPSSIGLSFIISKDVDELNVRVSWGDYQKTSDGKWQRYNREGVVSGLPVNQRGLIKKIPLSKDNSIPGITIVGVDDSEITIEGIVHDIGEVRAVSLFLVNRRRKAKLGDKLKDERWILQPKLEITIKDESAGFLSKDIDDHVTENQAEDAVNKLLYRDYIEFATGHGVSAGWSEPLEDKNTTHLIYTDYIPEYNLYI